MIAFGASHLSAIGYVFFVVDLAIFVGALVAFVDSGIRAPAAYVVVGRGTKGLWMGILGAAALLAAIGWAGVLSIFGIASMVAILVYFVDQRPKLRATGGGVIRLRWPGRR
ncbi:MAG TPA: DUF2516 family protein [Mycobacteriales bacterium]|nr:DUF2516 family protein [Mycobacteriales bacterium]